MNRGQKLAPVVVAACISVVSNTVLGKEAQKSSTDSSERKAVMTDVHSIDTVKAPVHSAARDLMPLPKSLVETGEALPIGGGHPENGTNRR